MQRAVERAGEFLDALRACGVEVRPADVTDEQRIPREYDPGLLAATVICDQVGVVHWRVARRGDRMDRGVAKLQELAVRERPVLERGPSPLRHVSGGSGALDEPR